jgi:hypothetical protein
MGCIDIEQIADRFDLPVNPSQSAAAPYDRAATFVEPKLVFEAVHFDRYGRSDTGLKSAGLYQNGFAIELLLKGGLFWRELSLFAAS